MFDNYFRSDNFNFSTTVPMNILVVDDHDLNRTLLSHYIQQNGHQPFEAANGLEACNIVEKKTVDLVFMDIGMPVMDGYEACRRIKSRTKENFIPIIFVTGSDDEETLAKCISVGGDDFIAKPISELILISKLKAHQRTLDLFKKVNQANESLLYHNRLMEREHKIVERIFENSINRIDADCSNVKYYVSPMSMFNGDLLLVSPGRSEGVYVLLGDFTGHGLAAAVGSLPVSDIFYSMAAKQASVGDIAKELNKCLLALLPENMFFCAVIMELNKAGDRLTLWIGGMNDVLLTNAAGKIKRRIKSMHMPLGILPINDFENTVQTICPENGQKIFAFTDGVLEAMSPEGEMFGQERLNQVLEHACDNHIEAVFDAVVKFQNNNEQADDISLVELTCLPVVHPKLEKSRQGQPKQTEADTALPWRISVALGPDQLRHNDTVEQIVRLVSAINGVSTRKDLIFTLISELFSNSLEHGLLQLSSEDKNSPEGFASYYVKREERLRELRDGNIDVVIRVESTEAVPGINKLNILLTDNGQGFDVTRIVNQRHDEKELYYGRGIMLVRSLCNELEYSNGGRTVSVNYSLD